MKRFIALLAVSLAALGAQAQSSTATAQPASKSSLATQDRKFLDDAAKAGVAEVALGGIAKDRAQSQQVKDFAATMVKDHTDANSKLQGIASGKGIAPPADMTSKDKRTQHKLEKLAGTAFDAAYVKSQLDAHKDAVALFRKESTSGRDPELKAFATDTLPTLEKHLQHVQDLAASNAKKR